MHWRETLADIFGGYLNQQTIEDAVDQMIFVSSANDQYHQAFQLAFSKGIESVRAGDKSIIDVINTSGFQVDSFDSAARLIGEFQETYLRHFEQAKLRT